MTKKDIRMRTKKLLILTTLGIVSSCAWANGPNMYIRRTPDMRAIDSVGVYLEGLVGYNRYAFKEALHSGLPWDNGMGNWAFAADLGYQFQKYFSAELGGIYTLRAKEAGVTHRPWYAFLAGKFSIPVCGKARVFTKLGAGYQKLIDKGGESQGNGGPVLGAGLSYHFTPQFYMLGQWLRFTGQTKVGTPKTSAPNIFLIGFGYKFAM